LTAKLPPGAIQVYVIGHVGKHPDQFAGIQQFEMIEVAADVSRGPRKCVQLQGFEFWNFARQKTPLSFFGQCEIHLEFLPPIDTLCHLDAFKHGARFGRKLRHDSLIQTRSQMHRPGAIEIENPENFQ
jgi:hypothetical protein